MMNPFHTPHPWRWWHIVPALFLLPLCGNVITALADALVFISFVADNRTALVSLCQFLLIVMASAAMMRLGAIGRGPMRWDISFRPFLRIMAVTFALFIVVTLAVELFEMFSPKARAASATVFRSLGFGRSAASDTLMILGVAAFGPLAEELLMRGLMLRGILAAFELLPLRHHLIRRFGLVVAIIVSSAAFMDMHGGEGQDDQLFMLFLMGALFAASYCLTGSLVGPVMIHAMNNSFALFNGLKNMPQISTGHLVLVVCCPLIAVGMLFVVKVSLASTTQVHDPSVTGLTS